MVLAYTKKYRFLAKNLILGCSLRQKKENEKGKNKQCYLGNTAQFPPYGLSTAPAAAERHLRCQNTR